MSIQNEYKREQSLIVEQLCLITNKPTAVEYPFAGKIRREFGFDIVLSTFV